MYNYVVHFKEGFQKLVADAYEFRSGWLTFFEFSKETQDNVEKKIVTATWAFKEADIERIEIESK